MPYLPLDHPEPFAATLGVMLYPRDASKAKSFTDWFISNTFLQELSAGHEIDIGMFRRFAHAGSGRPRDLELRFKMGIAVGTQVKILFAIFCTDERLASWRNARKIVAHETGNKTWKAGEKSLEAWLRELRGVAHLWAALVLRGGKLVLPGIKDFDGPREFQFFLAEAETIRAWGQQFIPGRAKATPPLPKDMWRTPLDWAPPTPDYDGLGHSKGAVRGMLLLPEQAELLNPPGRPRKFPETFPKTK